MKNDDDEDEKLLVSWQMTMSMTTKTVGNISNGIANGKLLSLITPTLGENPCQGV